MQNQAPNQLQLPENEHEEESGIESKDDQTDEKEKSSNSIVLQ